MTPRLGRGLLILMLWHSHSVIPAAFAARRRGGRRRRRAAEVAARGGGGGGGGGGGMPRRRRRMPRRRRRRGSAGFSRQPRAVSSPEAAPGGGRPGGRRLQRRASLDPAPAGPSRRRSPGSRCPAIGRPWHRVGRPGVGDRPGIDRPPRRRRRRHAGIDSRPAASAASVCNRPGIDNRPGGVGGVGGIGNRPGIDNRPGGVGGVGGRWHRQPTRHRQPARRRRRRRLGIDSRPASAASAGRRHRQPADHRERQHDQPGRRQRRGNPPEQPGRDRRRPGLRGSPARLQQLAGRVLGLSPGMGQRLLARLPRQQHLGLGPVRRRGRGRRDGLGPRLVVLQLGLRQLREPLLRRGGRGAADRDRADGRRRRAPDGDRPRLAYDYSQPIDTQAAPPPAEVADPAIAKFDSAREAFGSGDYAGALRLTDEALKVLPNDATLHEFRALVLFAVGKYDLAAGPLYAVLSVGPGWDWTTMAGLYPSIDVYTAQLRKLEAFVRANPTLDGRPVRPGLSLPDPGPHRRRRGPAQAGRGPGAPGHALRPARQAVLQARHGARHAAGNARPGGGSDTGQAGQAGRQLDRAPDQRHDHPPEHRGRRGLHLDGRLQGQAQQLAGKWSLADDLLTLAQDRDTGGPWSAASPGRPTTGGTSA